MRPLRTSSQPSAELVVGPLLAAGLDDALGGPGHLGHDAALVEREGEGLLAIDILARLAGMRGHQGMPVVGRAR
jgi:hypothetical protein